MRTYKIKTHNPWAILFVILGSISLSIWFLKDKYGDGVSLLFGLVCVFGSLLICYYLLADTIDVTITHKGINSSWMIFPFFNKISGEILLTEIEYWNIVRSKMMDAFIIKTKNKETFSIRCLNIYSTQSEFSNFLKDVSEQIEIYNKEQSNNSTKIKPVPSLFETNFGLILAIIFMICILGLTYYLMIKPVNDDSAFLARTIIVYIFILIFIGLVIRSQLVKRRKTKRDKNLS